MSTPQARAGRTKKTDHLVARQQAGGFSYLSDGNPGRDISADLGL